MDDMDNGRHITERLLESVWDSVRCKGNILLAVSGGVDSTVLADAVFRLRSGQLDEVVCKRRSGVLDDAVCERRSEVLDDAVCKRHSEGLGRVGVAHVNFHLRGKDSDRDQEFVRNLSQRYGFEFYTVDFDTFAYAAEHKLSVEIAARELRYNWFCKVAAEHGFDLLLTAHNANDNAETLLLNLVRGTGRRGLGAIRPYGAVEGEGAMSAALKVSRPLLSVERSEIEEYAKENNLRYCIDRTNFENDYSRNRIRNQVLPILRQLNPSVISSLNKDIRRFRELNSVVDELLEDRLQSLLAIGQGHGGRGVLDALRRRFLVFSAEAAKLVSYGNTGFYVAELFRRFDIRILRDQTEGIARCLTEEVPQSKAASKIFYAGSHTAVIERGQLKVYSLPADFVAASESEDRTGLDKTVSISSCGTYSFGPYKILVEEVALQAQGKSFPQTLQAQGKSVLDAAKLSFPLTLRTVQDGDRFSPYGLKGSKKVSDFLNSRKTDLVFKNILPVITQKDGSIVCLPSFEIDDRFKVTSLSKKILTVCVSL